MAAFDYGTVAKLFRPKPTRSCLQLKVGAKGDIPLGTGDLRARRTPSVSQSRNFQPSYFQARAWKSMK
jgi:hypothetical protein